ncbi:MAG: aminoacyl-tRNA hydrolase [Oscillospiraceae bacterium]|nr:aminoacyl-tRNA hydrolase [Oscillospiraceae bacterium]
MSIFDIFKSLEEQRGTTSASGKITWIIAGLGNPGMTYANTRHNAGFMALEQLAKSNSIDVKTMRFKSDCGDGNVGGERCLLMKPATFMNLSGEAISQAAAFYKIPPERIVIMYDDISLPPGKLRIRRKGSAGGHNGMKSIIALLGTDEFPRVRIGVGAKPNPDYDLADWVLSKFTEDDMKNLTPALENAAKAAELIVQGKIDEAMNKFTN